MCIRYGKLIINYNFCYCNITNKENKDNIYISISDNIKDIEY